MTKALLAINTYCNIDNDAKIVIYSSWNLDGFLGFN